MNKTIIININGIVFHIEEDAYEVLKNYMTDVKRHFIDSADSLEITTDIENRIAEMFTEILARENKQVIVEQDVHTVITQMGTVEDFASVDEEGNPAPQPSFGAKVNNRRLFRDPDDHLIGGVCSGIANYFEIQAVWIRLAFVLAFICWGTGLLAYIILWIVVPKAITRADRMAMKGEPLDLQGFKKNFEDEIKNVHGRFNDLHHEARPVIYKTRDFVGDFFDHLRVFLTGAGRVLVKILGICILLTCVGFIIALIIGVFAYFAYGNTGIYHIFPFNIINRQYNFPFMAGSFLLLALPLLAIILLIIRLIFDRTTLNRATGFTLLMLWMASLMVVIYYSVQIAAEFRSSGTISQTINVTPSADSVYYLKMNNVRYLSKDDSAMLDIKHGFMGKTIVDSDNDFDDDDNNISRNISINIEKSDVPQPVLVESFTSRGRNYTDALINTRNISYRFNQTGNNLTFDRHIRITGDNLWRGQELRLTLKIPMNAKLVIDDEADRYLDGANVYDCKQVNKNENGTNATFIMTENGLQCKVDTLVTKPDSTLNKP